MKGFHDGSGSVLTTLGSMKFKAKEFFSIFSLLRGEMSGDRERFIPK